jgi:hypothetical protein
MAGGPLILNGRPLLRGRCHPATLPLLLHFLGPLQQRRHIGPELAAGFLLGFGEFGERRRIADAGEVGIGLPVLERLHRGGTVVRFTLIGYHRRGSMQDGKQLLRKAGNGV